METSANDENGVIQYAYCKSREWLRGADALNTPLPIKSNYFERFPFKAVYAPHGGPEAGRKLRARSTKPCPRCAFNGWPGRIASTPGCQGPAPCHTPNGRLYKKNLKRSFQISGNTPESTPHQSLLKPRCESGERPIFSSTAECGLPRRTTYREGREGPLTLTAGAHTVAAP